jgi:hypothetical protein
VAFREVGVHEVREVLRLWLRGEGLRAAGRMAQVDRKTVRYPEFGITDLMPRSLLCRVANGRAGPG